MCFDCLAPKQLLFICDSCLCFRRDKLQQVNVMCVIPAQAGIHNTKNSK